MIYNNIPQIQIFTIKVAVVTNKYKYRYSNMQVIVTARGYAMDKTTNPHKE